MSLSSADLQYLVQCATAAARKAGGLIAQSRPEFVEHKPGGGHSPASQVVTEVDRRSQDVILEALAPTLDRFGLGVLTEEREDDGGRLREDHFWCIDPLDGTLPFIESVPGYSVSIALVSRQGVPQLGAVFDPVEQSLYHAARGLGVFRNDQPWTIAARPVGKVLSVFMDRSFVGGAGYDRTVAALAQISGDLGLQTPQIRTTGAAVMNACWVLAQPPACYFKFPKPHDGGGSLWDYAATACLFHEAGAVATDIHGDDLDLNRADSTFMNHRGVLFATDQELAARLRALQATRGTAAPGVDSGP